MLCKEAIELEYYIPGYYRNLAEVYLIWGKKPKAISVLKNGIRITKDDELLVNELKKMGSRKRPPIPFLDRSNPINRYIGIVRHRMSVGSM